MNKITAGLTPITRISFHENALPPVQFAAEELQVYLKKSLDVEIKNGVGVPDFNIL